MILGAATPWESWDYSSVREWDRLLARLCVGLLCLLIGQTRAAVVCAACHPKESASFASSAMGRSIGDVARTIPAGKVTHSESGSVVTVSQLNGRMTHRLEELGFKADYNINYQVGAGKVGESFFTRVGGNLLQSPASFYKRFGWDVSPGFKDATVLDFDRVIGERCLFCHSNNSAVAGEAALEAIDCERCHGDTRQHLTHPSKATIVNPARLPMRTRDSVCEQCHLEGVASVLNAGKRWQDFHAGDELENTFSVYVDDDRRPGAKAVSQVEQLALSQCARKSGGQLWCGSCHNPHGSDSAERQAEVKAICVGCHAKLSIASHPNGASDCVRCHMPRLNPNDIAHAASTDHRILARPMKAVEASSSGSLRVWHGAPPDTAQRNLALAELRASALPEFHALGETAGVLLEKLPIEQRDSDPIVLAALGSVELERGKMEESSRLFEKAFELSPKTGQYAMYAGIALKRSGNMEKAVAALRNAIAADASLQQAYLELSAVYAQQGRRSEAAEVLNAYLTWNPQSILVRSAKQGLQ